MVADTYMADSPDDKKSTDFEDGELKFELIVGDAGGQIDNGDVPIRWCTSPDFVKELEAKGVIDPHVLIASYHPNSQGVGFYKEMDRKLIPLAEMMTFLRFTRAGKCKIYGMILDGRDGRGELHERWMRRKYGEYDCFIDTYKDELYNHIDYEVARTSEFVVIPEGVFGKEPSPWVKWYVNLWHNQKDRIADECDFRKRFLIAFIFKWIPFIPFVSGLVLMRVCGSGILSLAGYHKKVRFMRSFRPYEYPSFGMNVLDGDIHLIDDNIFLFNRKNLAGGSQDKSGMLFGMALTPIFALVVAMVVAGATSPDGIVGLVAMTGSIVFGAVLLLLLIDAFVVVIELMIRWDIGGKIAESIINTIRRFADLLPTFDGNSNVPKITLFAIIGLCVLALIGIGLKFLVAFLGMVIVMFTCMFGFFFVALLFSNKILDWLEARSGLSAKANDYGNLTALLCAKEEDNLRPNYKFIPKKQRTVRLWYRDLKNKVCKPMQS